MEKVVLDVKLKFVLSSLNTFQRGELLENLLGMAKTEDETVANLCRYIELVQPEEGGVNDDGAVSATGVNDTRQKRVPKRKVTKENNFKNKNTYGFIFCPDDEGDTEGIIPTLEEVRTFAEKNGLQVDAEEFIDFYDSHGWRVGKTPIRNWQATMRLWHRRAKKKMLDASDDEAYWSELEEAVKGQAKRGDATLTAAESEPAEEKSERSPFEAFIEQIGA